MFPDLAIGGCDNLLACRFLSHRCCDCLIPGVLLWFGDWFGGAGVKLYVSLASAVAVLAVSVCVAQ